MTFSQKLNALKTQYGISNEMLAEKTGIPLSVVEQWENGTLMPDIEVLIELADIFGTSVDTLVKDGISLTAYQSSHIFTDDTPTGEIPDLTDITDDTPTGDIPDLTDIADNEPVISERSKAAPVVKRVKKTNNKNHKKLHTALKLFVTAVLCGTVVLASVVALFTGMYAKKHQPVYILVHGIGGSGRDIAQTADSTYWGDDFSISDNMEKLGYEVYEASVGPYSSAWDRACELYAQLTGTQVDYGEAHSKAHNHQRYGRTYAEPLFEGWGRIKKINLIGHSFGGTTARLLTYLLTYGDKAERKASGNEVSPLFEGGKGGYVKSVTTLCTPHNGSTIYYIANGFGFTNGAANLLSSILGITGSQELMLEQFGINDGSFDFSRISDFVSSSTDNAFYDISPDTARQLNSKIKASRCVYYFSYYCSATKKSSIGNNYLPISSTSALMKASAVLMGGYDKNKMTDFTIDASWLDNDGLVNVVSAKYPFTEKHTDYSGGSVKKGVWNVMPVITGDHKSVIGVGQTEEYINSLYSEIFSMLKGL